MINRIIEYFDLYSGQRAAGARAFAGGPGLPSNWWIFAHFLALVAGIVAKPYVDAYQAGNIDTFQFSLPLIIFSSIVAIAIFPAVFKNSYDTTNPKFVQLCLTFAGGLGYQSLFAAAVNATGAS